MPKYETAKRQKLSTWFHFNKLVIKYYQHYNMIEKQKARLRKYLLTRPTTSRSLLIIFRDFRESIKLFQNFQRLFPISYGTNAPHFAFTSLTYKTILIFNAIGLKMLPLKRGFENQLRAKTTIFFRTITRRHVENPRVTMRRRRRSMMQSRHFFCKIRIGEDQQKKNEN